jgi:predicted lipoprotein with Yx(FWY)xxD motif
MTRSFNTTRCLAILLLGLASACAGRGSNDTAADGGATPNDSMSASGVRSDTTRAGQTGVGAGMQGQQVTLMVSGSGTDSYIATSDGRAIYILEGTDGSQTVTCTGECATSFEPLTGTVTVQSGAGGLQQSMLSQVTASGGQQQATYNGRPLWVMRSGAGRQDSAGHGMTVGSVKASRISPSGSRVGGM